MEVDSVVLISEVQQQELLIVPAALNSAFA
jgi:hypothetical protein